MARHIWCTDGEICIVQNPQGLSPDDLLPLTHPFVVYPGCMSRMYEGIDITQIVMEAVDKYEMRRHRIPHRRVSELPRWVGSLLYTRRVPTPALLHIDERDGVRLCASPVGLKECPCLRYCYDIDETVEAFIGLAEAAYRADHMA